MNDLSVLSEAQFTAQTIHYARLRGWLVHHCRPARMNSGRWATPVQGDVGFPDLVMAREGRVVLAELKTTRGRVTATQQRWHQHLEGAEFYVWRPDDWDDVIEILR